ncbi:hypothetical protein [Cohnella silvisoli]|uniref:Uncharacterized protein n=1 Tax=Cohnella silvisoli TaxID=2873699 RepID=A0ABV1L3M4_9BACL|nr:hypothetical protein [Cohnella silvisoli]MCD9026194.1 hypothetical protein [Cohnella silvisoli]
MRITHGYNKDGRPDLKQIVIGLGVTPERIPLIGKAENGNQDDKTWNHEFIQKLRLEKLGRIPDWGAIHVEFQQYDWMADVRYC